MRLARLVAFVLPTLLAGGCLIDDPYSLDDWSVYDRGGAGGSAGAVPVFHYDFPSLRDIDDDAPTSDVDTSRPQVEGNGATATPDDEEIRFNATGAQTLVIPLGTVPANAIGIIFEMRGIDDQAVIATLRHDNGEASLGVRLTERLIPYAFYWEDFDGDDFEASDLRELALRFASAEGGELWLGKVSFILGESNNGGASMGGGSSVGGLISGGRDAGSGGGFGGKPAAGQDGFGGEAAGAGGAGAVGGGGAGGVANTECPAGSYDDDGTLGTDCVPWRDCPPGQYVSGEGTPWSNRECEPCVLLVGEFSSEVNASSCALWRDCQSGEYVSREGTSTSDRECVSCSPGENTYGPNQSWCLGRPLATGHTHTCMIRDGAAWCWGSDREGQLGNGDGSAGYVPTQVSGLSDIVELGAGSSFSCARLHDGSVYCWGTSSWGVLGRESESDVAVPVRVAGIGEVVELVSGAAHNCARVMDSTVYCWGSDSDGQLGNGDLSHADRAEPGPVLELTGAIRLAAGVLHTCALLPDATVHCWGDNELGQIGAEATGNNVHSPVAVSNLTGVVDITAGGYHTCALLDDRTVQCWGYAAGDDWQSPIPVPVPELRGVAEIRGGGFHTCARLESGAVYCWGDNTNGQLGNMDISESLRPLPVAELTDAVALSAGLLHSCALLAGGDVVCWGRNQSGELGFEPLGVDSSPPGVVQFPFL